MRDGAPIAPNVTLAPNGEPNAPIAPIRHLLPREPEYNPVSVSDSVRATVPVGPAVVKTRYASAIDVSSPCVLRHCWLPGTLQPAVGAVQVLFSFDTHPSQHQRAGCVGREAWHRHRTAAVAPGEHRHVYLRMHARRHRDREAIDGQWFGSRRVRHRWSSGPCAVEPGPEYARRHAVGLRLASDVHVCPPVFARLSVAFPR